MSERKGSTTIKVPLLQYEVLKRVQKELLMRGFDSLPKDFTSEPEVNELIEGIKRMPSLGDFVTLGQLALVYLLKREAEKI